MWHEDFITLQFEVPGLIKYHSQLQDFNTLAMILANCNWFSTQRVSFLSSTFLMKVGEWQSSHCSRHYNRKKLKITSPVSVWIRLRSFVKLGRRHLGVKDSTSHQSWIFWIWFLLDFIFFSDIFFELILYSRFDFTQANVKNVRNYAGWVVHQKWGAYFFKYFHIPLPENPVPGNNNSAFFEFLRFTASIQCLRCKIISPFKN